MKTLRRYLWLFCAFLYLAPVQALADAQIISADNALTELEAGNIIMLDIRTRQEWNETGIAKGAWPVSMHERDFGQRLQKILETYPAENIALICATGGRTSYVGKVLEQNGIVGLLDVSEGMMGNGRGPGWLARGLPITPLGDAERAYQAATSQD